MNKTYGISYRRLSDLLTGDFKLMGLSRQGAYECLYGAYLERMNQYISSRVFDTGLVEDMTAQVFLEAWDELPSFQAGKSSIAAWLSDIADRVVVNYNPGESMLPLRTPSFGDTNPA